MPLGVQVLAGPKTLLKAETRERSTNSNFWVRISSGGAGIFHVKCGCGGLEGQGNKLLGGISRDFGWDILGAPEKLEKTFLMFVFSIWPALEAPAQSGHHLQMPLGGTTPSPPAHARTTPRCQPRPLGEKWHVEVWTFGICPEGPRHSDQ